MAKTDDKVNEQQVCSANGCTKQVLHCACTPRVNMLHAARLHTLL